MIDSVICGDVLDKLPEIPTGAVHCCVTSPPYWGLRDYGTGTWAGGNPPIDMEYYRDLSNGELQTEADVLVHCGDVSPVRVQCDHGDEKRKTRNMSHNDSDQRQGRTADESKLRDGAGGISTVCGKCGAVREDKQIGLEKTPEEYVAKMVAVFREVWRVLRDDGTLWLNLGDSYNAGRDGGHAGGKQGSGFQPVDERYQGRSGANAPGLKPKDLCGIPWRVAFALQADGWYLRQDIIWHKPNPMPESVRDRCTKAHEYIFLLTKKPRYYYDAEAIKEPQSDNTHSRYSKDVESGLQGVPDAKEDSKELNRPGYENWRQGTPKTFIGGRNKRSVWTVPTAPYSEAHFATFPPDLILPCILAGCPQQVCKKCGEPRRRITETEQIKRERKTPITKPCDERSPSANDVAGVEVKTTGWTDCGCKQYFCNTCKKFLTPDLVNGIMTSKGDNYAIQGHREKEEVLKRVGKEKVSGTERTRGDVEADSLLCEKELSDLWNRIFRAKDATDLFSEMRGSVADTKREPQQLSEGATTIKLQGGVSQQERVQSNPDKGEICNGTPLLDGATSGAETNLERGSSPQKRDKGRQQTTQSCDKSEKVPPRNSVVSALQKEFQTEITCPCCSSSQITIEPAGFDGGVVLDPFMGSGTVAVVAYQNNRHYIGIELNPEYCKLGRIEKEKDKYALFND